MPSSKTEKRFIQSRDFIVAEPAGVGVVDFYVVMNEFEENKLERERERVVLLTNRKWYWRG